MSNLINTDLKSSTRLITKDELMDNLGYSHGTQATSGISVNTEYTPSWVYSNSYWYWTMTPYNSESKLWYVISDGKLYNIYHVGYFWTVRPVVTLYKSVLSN